MRRVLMIVPFALALGYLLVPGAASVGGSILNLYNLSAVVSAIALLVAVEIQRPRPLWPWLTIAGSLLLWVGGDVVYTALGDEPTVSIADAFYVLGYVGLIAATLCFVRARTHQRGTDSFIDVALVSVAGILASWELVIEPALQTTGISTAGQVVAVLYPLLDAVLLLMLVRLLLAPGPRVAAGWLLAAGMGTIFLADTAYLLAIQSDAYVGNLARVLDSLWLVGYALFPIAVLSGSMRDLTTRASSRDQSKFGSLFIAAAALLSIPAIQIGTSLQGREPGLQTLVVTAVTIVPLIVWRLVRLNHSGVLARDELDRQRSYYRAVANKSSDAFVVIDADGTVRDASSALGALLGFGPSEAIGADGLTLVVEDDREHAQALLRDSLAKPNTTVVGEVRMRTASGVELWVELRCTNLLDVPAVGGVVVNTHDVTARKDAERELEHQAFHDALTGLANRALLKNRIEHALARSARPGCDDVAVLFCDLDGFKPVNDRLGHNAGDRLLQIVAGRLSSAVRPGDTVARLGGDEFAVLLEGASHLSDEANVVADRMLYAISDPVAIDGAPVVVTASVGVAVASEGGQTTVDELLRDADTAMYGAKAAGRNRVLHYETSMRAEVLMRAQLEIDLRGAVEREELVLLYQPQFELARQRLKGFETLVRWQHPTRGLIEAAEFLPIAEESGAIQRIGTWALETACRGAQAWQHLRTPEDDGPLTVSVNLSSRQLESPGLVDDVRRALVASGLPPEALVLELTESLLVDHPAEVAEKLRALKGLGIRLAIDEFGVGYSSLSYLRQFPIDILKIDRSFVETIVTHDGVPAIVHGLLDLARTLQLETVAEGIETNDQVRSLTSEGCDLGQGFLFAEPLADGAALDLVRSQLRAGSPATT